MSKRRQPAQLDLFGTAPAAEAPFVCVVDEAFIQGIRDELHRTIAMVTAATADPWPNPTSSLLAQMRFRDISESWLPAAEAAELWTRFDTELIRLYGPDEDEDETEDNNGAASADPA